MSKSKERKDNRKNWKMLMSRLKYIIEYLLKWKYDALIYYDCICMKYEMY